MKAYFRLVLTFSLALLPYCSLAQTPPDVPGVPAFSNIAATSVTVTAPALPTNATSLTLQKKETRDPDAAFRDVVTGLAGNAATNATALTPRMQYSFRYVAVGNGGSTLGEAGTVWTRPPPPSAPVAPTYSNILSTSVTVHTPALPDNAVSLTLQRADWDTDPNFTNAVEVATELGGETTVEVTNLSSNFPYGFRLIAVGRYGDTAVGTKSHARTLPPVPPAPDVQAITGTSTQAKVPVPAVNNWNSMRLQVKRQGEPDSAYVTVVSGVWYGTVTVTELAPNTDYDFRWLSCVWDCAIGPATAFTTGNGPEPEEPGEPNFSDLGPTSLDVTAPGPNLPNGATHLKLQRKLQSQGNTSYADVANNLSAGTVTPVTGLNVSTAYTFRYVAIGTGGSTVGRGLNVTTTPQEPEAPATPTFSNIGQTSADVTMPPLPARAISLTLQQQQSNGTYSNVQTGLAGDAVHNVAGLTKGTNYGFRAVAVNASGSTNGPAAGMTTSAPVPGSPGAPTFSNLTTSSVTVTAPSLTTDAQYLTLQGKAASQADAFYSDIATDLVGGAHTPLNGLTSGMTYTFRYVAVGVGGNTAGTADDVVMAVRTVTWSAGTPITSEGIRWPTNNAPIAPGAEGRLSSYVATDWDRHDVTINNVTVTKWLSDTCVYYWDASGGSFKYGINKGQSVVWIAPTTPGTYTIDLIIVDQDNGAKAPADSGSRDDTSRGYWDDPVKFQVSVTVTP